MGLGIWTGFVEPRRRVRFGQRFLRSIQKGLKLRAPVVESYFQEVDALASMLCQKCHCPKGLVRRANLLRRVGFCGVSYELLNQAPFDFWSTRELAQFESHLEVAIRLSKKAPFLAREAKVLEWIDRPYFLHQSSEGVYFAARVLRLAFDYNLLCSTQGLDAARETVQAHRDTYDPILVDALAEVLHWNRDVSRSEALV